MLVTFIMNKDSKKEQPKQCTIPSVRRSCLVNIGLIRMDRYPMNPSTLSLIDYLREGGKVPAIKIAKHPNGGYIIRDGRHRILAHKLLGRTKIKAKFSDKAMFNYS